MSMPDFKKKNWIQDFIDKGWVTANGWKKEREMRISKCEKPPVDTRFATEASAWQYGTNRAADYLRSYIAEQEEKLVYLRSRLREFDDLDYQFQEQLDYYNWKRKANGERK